MNRLDLPPSPTVREYFHVAVLIHEAGHAVFTQIEGGTVPQCWIDANCAPSACNRVDCEGGHHGQTEWRFDNWYDSGIVLLALAGKAAERRWYSLNPPPPEWADLARRQVNEFSPPDWAGYLKHRDQSRFGRDFDAAMATANTFAEEWWDEILDYARSEVVDRCGCMTTEVAPTPQQRTVTTTSPAAGSAATTTTGGIPNMSGVEEVRAGIGSAIETAQFAMAALSKAEDDLANAWTALYNAAGKSDQDEVTATLASWYQIRDTIKQQMGGIRSGVENIENYMYRL